MKFTQIATAIALGLALSAGAQAATATNTFNVKIIITGTCDAAVFSNAANASDIDFGTTPSATAAAARTANNSLTGNLTVQCTKGTAVTVGLKPTSATAGASTGLGSMGNGTDTIAYQLKQPTFTTPTYAAGTSASSPWGDIIGTNTVSVIGQGMTVGIKLPVAATIPANALDVSAGNYTEAVLATLTY